MAWYYKGRKYWYHNGKKYSKRIKKELFESYDHCFGHNFGEKGSNRRIYWVTKIINSDLKNKEIEKTINKKNKFTIDTTKYGNMKYNNYNKLTGVTTAGYKGLKNGKVVWFEIKWNKNGKVIKDESKSVDEFLW